MTKKMAHIVLILGLFAVSLAKAGFANDVTLALIPVGGAISGPPGATVGWGYTITNSTSKWLETLSLSADSFTNGTPNLIFDFPIVAPHSSVTEDFSTTARPSCASPPCGLYEFTWQSTAPLGSANVGTFTVSSDLFGAQPGTTGATDLGPAPDATALYAVSVATSPTVVPEPPSVLLLLSGLGTVLLLYQLSKCRKPI